MKFDELERLVEQEMALEEELEVTEDIYQSILQISKDLGKSVVLKKAGQLRRIAALTANHYAKELGRLATFFPKGTMGNAIPSPTNLKQVVANVKKKLEAKGIDLDEEPKLFGDGKNPILDEVDTPEEAYWVTTSLSSQDNDGLRREEGLVAYCNKIGPRGVARTITGTQAGKDIVIDGVACEVKSSKGSDPNYNLNSSGVVPDPNKAYLFMLNSTKAPVIFVVSSDLLYKVTTFKLVQPGQKLEQSVEEEVTKILGQVKLSDMVIKTILTGEPYDTEHSFTIGKSPISARFRLMFNLTKFK